MGGAKHNVDTLANLNSKISGGKTLVAKEDANTWSGNQEFDGEVTTDVIISDGNYTGFQIAKTVGTGGVTAKDALKFDASGQIVQRAAADDGFVGIACTTAAASATGYYAAMGVLSVLWTTGKEPTSYGQNVFLDNSPGNFHKWTTDVQTDGKVYRGIAEGTGASARVIIGPGQLFAFE